MLINLTPNPRFPLIMLLISPDAQIFVLSSSDLSKVGVAGFRSVILGVPLSLERLIASEASQVKIGRVRELSRVFAFGGDF